ncbi:MAG TPA: DUF302 domain-containing protein [Gammaproteobacteria bacterium]|nr:DUF302 domain-containing protein [Gammaproteobacteria bacterium]
MYKFIVILLISLSSSIVWADHGNLISKKSAHSVSVTINKLESVLKKKGITIFAHIDHQKGSKSVGKKLRPTELLIFGNPKLGTPLMQSRQTVGIDLPMKALAWEDENGQVWLTYTKPAAMAERHHITDKEKIIKKMTGALNKFTNIATAP